MIKGSVNSRREAVIGIHVSSGSGQRQFFDAVIDTGFSEFLTLPSQAISAMGLPRLGSVRMILGDGSEEYLDMHEAVVIWDGASRSVDVHAADTDPLVGMAMLARHELRIQVVAGGAVMIEAIP